jgi:MYND finger
MSWAQFYSLKAGTEAPSELINIVVPTRLAIQWKPAGPLLFDEGEVQEFFVGEMIHCCLCRVSMTGQVAFIGLRFLIARGKPTVITYASICEECPPYCTQDTNVLCTDLNGMDELRKCAREIFDQGHYDISNVGDKSFAREFHARRRAIVICMGAVMTRLCRGCKKTEGKLMLCSRCKYVRYCSTECSRATWPEHKKECDTACAPEVLFPDKDFMSLLMK